MTCITYRYHYIFRLKNLCLLYLIISFILSFCKIYLNLTSLFEIFIGSHEKLQGVKVLMIKTNGAIFLKI
jgi:hypothetical protein